MGENRGVRQATEMHAVSPTLTPAAAETGSAGDGDTSSPIFSNHTETPDHPWHRLQNSVAPYDALPALRLWVHAG